MSLTDTTAFPGGVDAFPDISAIGGDLLSTVGKEHDALHDKASKAVAALERISVGPTHVNVRAYGPIGSGSDETTIAAAATAAAAGNTLVFPPGMYDVDPTDLVPNKMLHYLGSGRFSSIIRAKSNAAGALLTVNPTTGSAPYNYYGPTVVGLGFDNSIAPLATGLLMGINAGWAVVRDIFTVGGAIGVENRGFNNWIEDFLIADAVKCFVIDGDTGLELTLCNGAMARNAVGTTTIGIEVICASVGVKGALMLNNVRGQSGTSGGVGTTSWLKMSAPSALSVPLFAEGVILDNCIGGGPGAEFINIYDVQFNNGWINCGAASGGPAVRINGGGRIRFTNNTLFGGGSPAKTYEIVAWPDGFISRGNDLPTAVVYYVPAGAPTAGIFDLEDFIPGSVVLANVTNNPTNLRIAAKKTWTERRFADIMQVDHIFNAGSATCQIGTLPGGTPNQVTITVPEGLDAFYTQFIPFRFSPAGTLGRLEIAGKSAGAGTVTIESASSTDTSIVGFFRFDIPH